MALVFHERVGLDGRRISPFSWRIRYAFAHKGLDPEVVPTRFADVDRIRALSGQHFVPIIEHDGQVVHDSWAIACHLEDRFPDRPSLFGGGAGRGAARLVNVWSDMTLATRDAAADLRRLRLGHRSRRPRVFPSFARSDAGHDVWRTTAPSVTNTCRRSSTHARRWNARCRNNRFLRARRRPMSITWCSRCSSGRASAVRAMCWRTLRAWTRCVPGGNAWWRPTAGWATAFRCFLRNAADRTAAQRCRCRRDEVAALAVIAS